MHRHGDGVTVERCGTHDECKIIEPNSKTCDQNPLFAVPASASQCRPNCSCSASAATHDDHAAHTTHAVPLPLHRRVRRVAELSPPATPATPARPATRRSHCISRARPSVIAVPAAPAVSNVALPSPAAEAAGSSDPRPKNHEVRERGGIY